MFGPLKKYVNFYYDEYLPPYHARKDVLIIQFNLPMVITGVYKE